jgi:hypothetical protein
LKQNILGTRDNFSITSSNILETVFPSEFYHDKQAIFIFKYTFPKIKTKLSWFKPEFTLHHGVGYGEMSDRLQHSFKFLTMEKGLYEGGLIFNGIFCVQFMHLGIGVFYRYGPYSDTNALKNIVPKLSLKIAGF